MLVFSRKRPEAYNYIQVQNSRWSASDPAFADIDTESAFWEYVEGPFLDSLEYDVDSNGVLKTAPFSGSYMIGNVMIRQKRVIDSRCQDHSLFSNRNITKRCHLR